MRKGGEGDERGGWGGGRGEGVKRVERNGGGGAQMRRLEGEDNVWVTEKEMGTRND